MFVNMLLPAMGVYKLFEPNGRGQCRVEETKGALGHSRRCIAELDLVDLGRKRLVVIKVGLAMVVPFWGVGYPLVALEA
jgi:hypothetical protein